MVASRRMTRPGSGFELASWYFFRLSGALLLLLALGHIFITHYLNAPSFTTFDFVARRYQGPIWRSFDWLLLVLALLHGLNGLRIVIDDYVRPAGWRVLLQSVNASLAIVFAGIGSVVIFSFDPSRTANVQDLTVCHVIDGLLVTIGVITYITVVLGLLWGIRGSLSGGLPIYAGGAGQLAWALHRATGLGVLFFLLIHIVDIALLGLGPRVYDCTVSFYRTPLLIPMEIALVGAVVYHALNGIRIMAIDFWKNGYYRQREMFYAVLALSILLVLPSVYVILTQG